MVPYLRDLLAVDRLNWNEQTDALLTLILLAWAIHAINWGFCNGGLNPLLGNRPRELIGIPGIVCSHFLHTVDRDKMGRALSNSHIVGNTVAFGIMGWFITLQGMRLFYLVTIAVALASGIGVWLFGTSGYHVGASGVTFGYCGFLLIYGVTSGNTTAFLIALLVGLVHGKFISGILPGSPGVSWEGHLFGFIGGALTAFLVSSIQLGVL